jgi:VanZ family protein
VSIRYLSLALGVAVGLIFSAPFIGQIRNDIRARFPGHFVLIIGSVIAISILGALALAIWRIRDRRMPRYAAVAAALVLAVGYAVWTAKPDPQINIVERFHFVQYGLVTLLFYKAWRPLGDGGVLLLPVVASLTVAVIEEWFQWFIPGRVGALEDVLLNWAAILSGLLFSLGIDPPPRVTLRMAPRSRVQLGVTTAAAILVFGVFFDSVHLGHEIRDQETGTFTSIYTAPELIGHAEDRAVRWRSDPPIDRTRLAREDQYRTEGIQHVRRRNEAWTAGDVRALWCENRILEVYYTPVLDAGHRWPPEQRAEAAQRFASLQVPAIGSTPYVSGAYPYRVFTWPSWKFWTAILALSATAMLAACVR